MRDYSVHTGIVFDIVAHATLSLYGMYFVKSEQVELGTNNVFFSGALVVGVALCMLLHNAIFRTAFFGLSLYGDHNIYGMVLTKDGVLSALLYFTGLCDILFIGYFYLRLLQRKDKNKLADLQ